ncbi:aminotransferase class III-fold pyridoxal phosphate-dependent enzyme [Oceanispirochaeta crateris]|uniref:Aminotransferase class III-fold pyridoxal phosphate-dependent enzyme n=1 Tax=Oceanispirochaeta crateris TaxID=2518645 RepID=A0A5C1QHZ3_9SPIO|nr:aminotransferase class III-fold pyridoxal phosphate-dependent enzyme [Oceanispirochaeta crateris]QEN07191.1 aminotransferase class III-fold pyridoxal phosphate-dependent enzyme [Oceanispirochaeta crateris]
MSANEKYKTSQDLFERAVKVIPGGIYGSKSPGFTVPGEFPYFFTEGEGCRVKDADGNSYIDYLCGFGSMILGFGNSVVDDPAVVQLRKGDLLNCPSPVFVELAERLCKLIDGMGWSVFAKNGSDATTLAVTMSRVHTGKRRVLMAKGAYHGSANWCSANEYPVLDDRDYVHTFPYGDEEALKELFDRYRDEIACIILTPYHHPTYTDQVLPQHTWYPLVESLCEKEHALFIMDDIRANFRLSLHGSHHYFNAHPHLVTMGKSLANGYPIAALMGTPELKKAASSLFITGTFWTSSVPMVAAMHCLKAMEEWDVQNHMNQMGKMLKDGLKSAAEAEGLKVNLSGPDAIPFMTFPDDPNLYHNQIFSAAMARRGVYLHPHHNWFLSYAHKTEDIEETIDKAGDSFKEVKRHFSK